MEKIPIFYYSLKLVFAGFIFYAAVQSAFIFIKMRTKETRALLFLSFASFLFILSDVLNEVFTHIAVREDVAVFFMMVKETMPVMFYFLAPYYLDMVLDLTARVKKINRAFFLAGIAVAAVITAATLLYPDLVLKPGYPLNDAGCGNDHGLARGPMIIIRNVIVFIFLVYSMIVVLMNAMHKKGGFLGKSILAGLVVLSYLVFNQFYILLFVRNETGFLTAQFPYLGLGIVILIFSMTMGVIELYISSFIRLEGMTGDMKSELYYDLDLEIANKLGFKKDLSDWLDESNKTGSLFSLVYLDIDDFQNINESYGESFGGEILKTFARTLKANFSEAGTLYRVGADEFAFLLKEMRTEGEAGTFASKILSSLKNPLTVSGVPYTLTASIAILFIPRDGNDIDAIMRNVYSTMRGAKKQRNTYEFFRRELAEGEGDRVYTVDLLRGSIARDEFILLYQPVLDAEGKLAYAEALLRCTSNNPAIGGPGHFMPLIEKAGLAKDIDNLVVTKSFYDIGMKIQNRFNVSINLSARQLTDPRYGDFLSSFAKQHGIEPRRITLEITENILVENMLLARASLAELKKNGFIIAIDDFGKGFSSLSYLAELPVDIIKIDMAFVHAVPGDAKKETLAKYIIDLGHSLGLRVVAEGFETSEQVVFFRGLGCDLYQGFYFSRPLPLRELLVKYFPA